MWFGEATPRPATPSNSPPWRPVTETADASENRRLQLGAMIPYFEGGLGYGLNQFGARTADEDYEALLATLGKRPYDYFKMFWADTAVFGSRAATECGLRFFGADQVVFASDAPFDPEGGPLYIRETIKVIDRLLSARWRCSALQHRVQRLRRIRECGGIDRNLSFDQPARDGEIALRV